jgi:hypothetical protein
MIACKFCIAKYGLKGSELETCGYCFETEEEFIKHLKDAHNIRVVDKK